MLVRLRDQTTPPAEFRRMVRGITNLLAVEATAHWPTEPTQVTTPLAETIAQALVDQVAIVPILRAGLGMADALLELLPDAQVWHVGLFRDEQTLQPTEYYNKLPRSLACRRVLVVDPMLATGGSAVRTCRLLIERGVDPSAVQFLSLIAAPEGVERLLSEFSDLHLCIAALDERINDVGFIVPGLGDAGDRQFHT
jgi:uracil phosphoribosyltransferase